MNIVFAFGGNAGKFQDLYLNYLTSVVPELVEKEHKVGVLTDSSVDLGALSSLNMVAIERIDSVDGESYLSSKQAVSDVLLARLLEIAADDMIDLIEFPLWSCSGFSTIRAKRLLGVFPDTKLVTNVLSLGKMMPRFAKGGATFEDALSLEMESYILRHSEARITPFARLAEESGPRYSRSVVQQYERAELRAWIDSLGDQDEETAFLKSLFSDPAEVIDHVALEEIYKPTPKKTHRRSKKEKRFVVLHPSGTETMDLFDESSGLANEIEFLEYNPSIAIKHALESSNADFVVIARNGLLFEPEFLKAAAESLTRNPDLSAVGCYIDGLRKYPFGYFQAGQALLNCGSPFANVYRKSSLLSILEEGETVPSNEWEWLIRLQQKFLTFDVLGSSLAHFENSTELAEQETPLTTLSDLLQKHSRFWISNASRMLLWTIHNPHLLELGANAGESEDRVSGFVIPGLDEFFLESESEVVSEQKPSETSSTDSSTENNDHETPDEEEPTLSLIEDTEEGREEQIAGLQEESPEPIAFEPDPGEEMPAEEATEEDTSEEVKEDRPVLLQIFWAEEGAFSEEDSITEIYEPENAMNFDVDIESIYNFNYLRLDLSNQPGVITLESIEIFDDLSQEVVFLANEENAFSNITPAGDVEVEGIELNTLELKAIGDDPQILISFDDISLRSARVSMKFGFRKAEFER